MTEPKRISTRAVVGMMSLVGIGGASDPSRYPLSFGNYFSLVYESTRENPWDGLRVANFWAENLREAAGRFLHDGMVSVLMWEWEGKNKDKYFPLRTCIIDDPRIPAEWYHNKMCWTGSYRPPLEVAQQMYAVRGDATNELEEWTDPVSYYAKRGGVYRNGIVSYTIKHDPNKTIKWPKIEWESKETLSSVNAELQEDTPDEIARLLTESIKKESEQ